MRSHNAYFDEIVAPGGERHHDAGFEKSHLLPDAVPGPPLEGPPGRGRDRLGPGRVMFVPQPALGHEVVRRVAVHLRVALDHERAVVDVDALQVVFAHGGLHPEARARLRDPRRARGRPEPEGLLDGGCRVGHAVQEILAVVGKESIPHNGRVGVWGSGDGQSLTRLRIEDAVICMR